MYKLKKKRTINIITDISLLSINVLLFLPKLILDIFLKKDSLAISFPLFLSILAYFFIPPIEYDLYRHYENYQVFIYFERVDFIKDYSLLFLFYIGKLFNLAPAFLPFISCFVMYYIWYNGLFKRISSSHNNFLFPVFFILFFISIPLVLFTGIRFALGLAFVMQSLFFRDQGKQKLAYIFLLLAILTHFSLIVIALIIIANPIIAKLNYSIRSIAIIAITFSIPFQEEISFLIIESIQWVNNKLFGWEAISTETYITGKWGVNSSNRLNEIGKLVQQIQTIGLLSIMILYHFLFAKYIEKKSNLFNNVTFASIILCIITFNYYAIFDRYGIIVTLLISYNLITYFKYKLISHISFVIFYFTYLLLFRIIDFKNNFVVYDQSYSDIFHLSLINTIYEMLL
ncbi:TPA: hypothetical protein U2J52_002995 [Providencia rettgeri]|uniref:hypothetical protein n=1 Tax=Providencia sp. PROV255 TaxID=2949943 RepID=UPI00234BC6BE|nr:hypothetical protein [Providencia sp. PROV255]HEM7526760.1 hypothetical protein [Providencia rettgeri]